MSDWEFGDYCQENLYIKAGKRRLFAMFITVSGGVEILPERSKGINISDLFLDACSPTKSELTLFNLEFGIDFPEKGLYNEFLSRNNLI